MEAVKNFCSAIKSVFVLLGLMLTFFTSGQSMVVAATESVADPSAMFDVQSTTKGMLVPRMTELQRDGIGSPASGLIIFQTDGNQGFYFYDGSGWAKLIADNGNIQVGSDGVASGGSAILDVKSTDKGVLFPRMTKAQRDAISSLEDGLMIYQTDNTPGLRIYNGSGWDLVTPKSVLVKDVKANGTAGGTPVAGSWIDRDLNTIEGSVDFISVNTNQITLQPGTYEIEASAPVFSVDNARIRLQNVTDGTTDIIGTSNFERSASDFGVTHITLQGTIVLNSTKTFELQNWVENSPSNLGFGVSTTANSIDEVYTMVKIIKTAD